LIKEVQLASIEVKTKWIGNMYPPLKAKDPKVVYQQRVTGILNYLRVNGPSSATALSVVFRVSKSRLQNFLMALVEKGVLERRPGRKIKSFEYYVAPTKQ
jgi:hypothetical protein